jgi:hypothetical protein
MIVSLPFDAALDAVMFSSEVEAEAVMCWMQKRETESSVREGKETGATDLEASISHDSSTFLRCNDSSYEINRDK